MGIADEGFEMERVLPARKYQDNPVYAGLIEQVDEAVGNVIRTLKKNALDKNTVIVFTSDNGGVTSGDNYSTNQLSLRGGKGYQWEGGLRVPYFIYVPWMTQEGNKIEDPVSGADLFPTLLDLANIPLRPLEHVDGLSLKPLLHGGETLLNPQKTATGENLTLQETLNLNEEKPIKLPQGTNVIRDLSIKLESYADSTLTRSVILKIEFDGQETVWCPIGDFFGSGIGLNPYQGWYRTVNEDGTMTSRWVMPYQKSAKVSLLNLGDKPVDFQLETVIEDYAWDEKSMYFNAAWRGENPVPTRPFSDWNYVTLKGRGVYVGDALTIMNPVEK